MTTPRVVIDCANLHVGGGVQVAASFIDEVVDIRKSAKTLTRYPWLRNIKVIMSSTVSRSVSPSTRNAPGVDVMNARPWSLWRWLPQPRRSRADVRFIVFGPHYGAINARASVLGYADVTSVYPRPTGVPTPPVHVRLRQRLRGVVSRRLLLRHQYVIVESPSMKDRLISTVHIDAQRISVIPNAYNAIFDKPDEWSQPDSVTPDLNDVDIVFIYVTRAYPHKNIRFVGEFLAELDRQGVRATCLTTLKPAEWDAVDALTKRFATNLGPLDVSELPSYYECADAALFPSLLEAFSAMPLEAMRMGKAVFASDRDFVRGTCADAPIYIDPLDPVSAAAVALEAFQSGLVDEKARTARTLTDSMPSALDRAEAYLRAIDSCLDSALERM